MGFLELMMECSVALGGFAAIHAALRGSTGPRGAFRAWGTVAFAFTSLLMSLVPLLLESRQPLDAAAWRLASVVGLALGVACVASNVWVDHQLSAAGYPPQTTWVLRSSQTLTLLAIPILLANLAGWPNRPGLFPYALATSLLFIGGVSGILASFWLALLDAIGRESPESPEP